MLILQMIIHYITLKTNWASVTYRQGLWKILCIIISKSISCWAKTKKIQRWIHILFAVKFSHRKSCFTLLTDRTITWELHRLHWNAFLQDFSHKLCSSGLQMVVGHVLKDKIADIYCKNQKSPRATSAGRFTRLRTRCCTVLLAFNISMRYLAPSAWMWLSASSRVLMCTSVWTQMAH